MIFFFASPPSMTAQSAGLTAGWGTKSRDVGRGQCKTSLSGCWLHWLERHQSHLAQLNIVSNVAQHQYQKKPQTHLIVTDYTFRRNFTIVCRRSYTAGTEKFIPLKFRLPRFLELTFNVKCCQVFSVTSLTDVSPYLIDSRLPCGVQLAV